MHKYVIFGPPFGLGDMLLCTPAMKAYHDLGYRVVLLLDKQWQPAVAECPFIYEIISLKILLPPFKRAQKMWWHGEYAEYTVKIINEYIDSQNGDMYYVMPYKFFSAWGDLSINAQRIPDIKLEKRAIHCRPYTIQADSGLQPRYPCYPILGFKRVPVSLPKGFKIGICVGSHDVTRRWTARKMYEILHSLDMPNVSNLIVGGVTEEEYQIIGEGHWQYIDRKLEQPINYCLSVLEQLDVLVSPDSGLIHACYPMKAHIIACQSRVFAEHVWHQRRNMDIILSEDRKLSCSKKCNAKLIESLLTRYVYDRLRDLSCETTEKIEAYHGETPRCFNDGVDCLETLDVQFIKHKIQEAMNVIGIV